MSSSKGISPCFCAFSPFSYEHEKPDVRLALPPSHPPSHCFLLFAGLLSSESSLLGLPVVSLFSFPCTALLLSLSLFSPFFRPSRVTRHIVEGCWSLPARDSVPVLLRTDSGPFQLRLSVEAVRIRTTSDAVPPRTKPETVQPQPPVAAPRTGGYFFLGGYQPQVLMYRHRTTEPLKEVGLRIVLIL